jgi:septin family protein
MTDKALLKAKIDLNNITANHAYEDYKQANFKPNGKRKSYKHIPYSLGSDTKEAQKVYNMVYGKDAKEITKEEEEQIKGFLLNYRTHRTEYLKDAEGNNYYRTA